MKIRVRLFHLLRQIAGTDHLEIDVPDGATVGDVRNVVFRRYPGMKMMSSALSMAQNMEYADPSEPAREGAEIALLPPVSGG